MAVVKRRLVQLLPEISIFLDVDDLEEIGDLELYIEQTGCILLFLSRGYFYSTNCMREATAVIEQKKPVVLLREADFRRGGITLADSMNECDGRPDVRTYIFSERPVTVWKRIQEHQLESLRQVAMSVLVNTPKYLGREPSSLGLHLPDEIRLQDLRLPAPLTLYVSNANRGAQEAARALCHRLGDRNVSITTSDQAFPPRQPRRRSTITISRRSSFVTLGSSRSTGGPTMLLYLNKNTWERTDDGSTSPLAAEVARARDEGVPLVMIHEADEERDGCEFGTFFQTT